jgi:hypothetical protein
VESNNNILGLQLSSQANTGLKIAPGQVVGGPIHVVEGQSVDINIDFNACTSIIHEGNGRFRLKPTLTAGVVSTNTTGIKGQVVDSVTSQPIVGATVALEKSDKSGTDRVFMEAKPTPEGISAFAHCRWAPSLMSSLTRSALLAPRTTQPSWLMFPEERMSALFLLSLRQEPRKGRPKFKALLLR